MAEAKPRYSFPVLKLAEIASLLEQLQIPCSLEDLKNPNQQVVSVVYEQFIMLLMEIPREEMRQPKFGALNTLEFPELHEESVPNYLFWRTALKMMRAAGMHDASIRDITMPEPQRTKQILSGLINFTKFKEDKNEMFQEFQKETDKLLETRQQLEHENQQLSTQLTDLTAQREAEMPAIQALETENASLNSQIAELNKQHSQLRDECDRVKTLAQECSDKIANDKFQMLNLKQENDKLKTQIVKSPQRLKRSLASMAVVQEDGKKEVADNNAKLRELQAKVDALERFDEKVLKRIRNMEEVSAEMKKAKTVFKDAKDVLAKCQETEDAIRDLAVSEQHHRKQIAAAQDKMFRLQRQFEQKKRDVQVALDNVNTEKTALLRANAKDKAKLDALEAQIAEMNAELDTMRATHDEEMNKLKQRYDALASMFSGYSAALVDAMTTTMTPMRV